MARRKQKRRQGLGSVLAQALIGGVIAGGAMLLGAAKQRRRAPYRPPAVPNFVPSVVRPSQPYKCSLPYRNGRVRGLFIGINYTGQRGQLQGCVNDVKTMLDLLARIQFPLQEACILVDDPRFPGNGGMPTRANIISHMQWLVHDARPGDCFFLHYSGHGTQVPDTSGQEADGMDECLVPVDHSTAGYLVDDLIYEILIRNLPAGVRLTVVMDCCHSGTALDLPYNFVANDSAMQNVNGWMMNAGFVREGYNQPQADVVMFSGCADSETSADVTNAASFMVPGNSPGTAGGACTNALAQVMSNTAGLTYVQILQEMKRILRSKGYKQVPQLSSSKPVDLHKQFSMFGAFEVGEFHPAEDEDDGEGDEDEETEIAGQRPPMHAVSHATPNPGRQYHSNAIPPSATAHPTLTTQPFGGNNYAASYTGICPPTSIPQPVYAPPGQSHCTQPSYSPQGLSYPTQSGRPLADQPSYPPQGPPYSTPPGRPYAEQPSYSPQYPSYPTEPMGYRPI